jgi:hypothetical protein
MHSAVSELEIAAGTWTRWSKTEMTLGLMSALNEHGVRYPEYIT